MTEIDDAIKEICPHYKDGPASEHELVYDSPAEALEAVYFWVLDFINDMFGGKNVEKIVDNFASSPGSGFTGEFSQRKSILQQNASNSLGTVNNILKGVINLLYDLREFKVRLDHYEDAESSDKDKKEAGTLALKQIWLDRVDMQRGGGSIHQMSAGNLNFVTLRDAFYASKSLSDVDNLDLNERVKRVLKPRLSEFFKWRERSHHELKKRFEIEKTYLKSQVAALKLNARWAKPYLKMAQQLEHSERLAMNPALVKVFNTVLLELTLMGKAELDVQQAVVDKDLPLSFAKIKDLRKYYSVVFIDFNFRGMPNRTGQQSHYYYSGRADVSFKAYALNEEELLLLKDKLSESDLVTALNLVEGMTEESLQQLKVDIEEFTEESEKEKKEKEEAKADVNPFTALFDFFKIFKIKRKKKEETDEEKIKKLKEKKRRSENFAEKYIRNMAEAEAVNNCFNIFDVYKKAHGMATFPYVTEAETEVPRTAGDKLFGFK